MVNPVRYFPHPVPDYRIPVNGTNSVIRFTERTGVLTLKRPLTVSVMPWSTLGGTHTELPLRIPESGQ